MAELVYAAVSAAIAGHASVTLTSAITAAAVRSSVQLHAGNVHTTSHCSQRAYVVDGSSDLQSSGEGASCLCPDSSVPSSTLEIGGLQSLVNALQHSRDDDGREEELANMEKKLDMVIQGLALLLPHEQVHSVGASAAASSAVESTMWRIAEEVATYDMIPGKVDGFTQWDYVAEVADSSGRCKQACRGSHSRGRPRDLGRKPCSSSRLGS